MAFRPSQGCGLRRREQRPEEEGSVPDPSGLSKVGQSPKTPRLGKPCRPVASLTGQVMSGIRPRGSHDSRDLCRNKHSHNFIPSTLPIFPTSICLRTSCQAGQELVRRQRPSCSPGSRRYHCSSHPHRALPAISSIQSSARLATCGMLCTMMRSHGTTVGDIEKATLDDMTT